jgi:hypothetical protein
VIQPISSRVTDTRGWCAEVAKIAADLGLELKPADQWRKLQKELARPYDPKYWKTEEAKEAQLWLNEAINTVLATEGLWLDPQKGIYEEA